MKLINKVLISIIAGASFLAIICYMPRVAYCQNQEIITTERYEFAEAYIHALGCQRRVEKKAKADLLKAGSDENKKTMALMRIAQRGILEITAAINYLDPYLQSQNKLIAQAANAASVCYKGILLNYKESLQIQETMNNPDNANNPSFDVGKIMSAASGITARQEYISETLFQTTQLMMAVLIDLTPDKDGRVSYLYLSSGERKRLTQELDLEFGD